MRLGALPRPDRNRHGKNTRDLVFYPLSLLLDNLMGGLLFQNRQSSFQCLSLPPSVNCSLLFTTSGIPKACSKFTMGGDLRSREHYFGAACFFFPSSLEPSNYNLVVCVIWTAVSKPKTWNLWLWILLCSPNSWTKTR